MYIYIYKDIYMGVCIHVCKCMYIHTLTEDGEPLLLRDDIVRNNKKNHEETGPLLPCDDSQRGLCLWS